MSYIKYKISMLAVCASLISPGLLSSAQNVDSSIQLKGMVVDEFGKPISGALLKSEKGKCEYLTKVDGTYEFNLKDGSQYITVSYIGYSDKIVSVDNKTELKSKSGKTKSDTCQKRKVIFGAKTKSDENNKGDTRNGITFIIIL